MPETGTRVALLDLAQELAQTRGLNAFSFQDLAKGVGISTASVHHHFPTKADLGRELMARYRSRFGEALVEIAAAAATPFARLERFVDLFTGTLRQGNRLCLCGMLASEYMTLPEPVRAEVRAFYDETEAWLGEVLAAGLADGSLAFEEPTEPMSRTILATLEGAMIAARTFDDEGRLALSARWLLASLKS